MALTKSKKAELLKDLQDITNAKTMVFAKFDKLSVLESIALRRSLKTEGTNYRVVKKTLLKRALGDKKIEGTIPELSGEIAIAWGEDILAPARGVYNFQKTHKEKIEIVGGIFDGAYKNKEAMLTIATI